MILFDVEFDTAGVLCTPLPPQKHNTMVKTDGGFIVHYDDSSIEHKLQMMRIKSESSNDSTLSSTDLDVLERVSGKENIRVNGDEEVEIDCD